MTGPLAGLRVVEFASIGPGPHCAMLLSDLGAEVLRIERKGGNGWPNPIMDRGRAIEEVDIRTDEGRARCLAILAHADVLIEGLRPGVLERLGLGPEACHAANPRLVYGRMTGWGQEGPLAQAAGHDINYIALTGALAAMGRKDEPAAVPLNLVGDFGGGSLYLAFGIMAALYERERSGAGQVVDAAIVDGVSSMMAMFTGLLPSGRISLERDRNLLGGAAPFYRTYLCHDGGEIAVGPLEDKFFAEFMDRLGLSHLTAHQHDTAMWGKIEAALNATFAGNTRDHWAALFAGSDACAFPVLTLAEAQAHPHMQARAAYVERDGIGHPAPAPRFSRTPGAIQDAGDACALLARWSAGAEGPDFG